MLLKDITKPISVKLNLLENDTDAKERMVKIVLLDREDNAISTISERDGASFKLDPKALAKAESVALLPADHEPANGLPKGTLRISPDQLTELIQPNGELTLSPERWRPLFPFVRCLDGKVQKCWWWPWFVQAQNNRIALQTQSLGSVPQVDPRIVDEILVPDTDLQSFTLPIFPRCRPICPATIEVYRRRCCRKFVIQPSDILDICERLKGIIELVPRIPPIPPVGPIPEPDPIPFAETGLFRGGVLDEAAINAEADLRGIQGASVEEAQSFIQARPRLLRLIYDCSDPVRVGQGTSGPDGAFSICFNEFPVLLPANCHFEYAFRVIQPQNGGSVVIYDGVAANAWFEPGEPMTLTTYNPLARDCEPSDPPPGLEHSSTDVVLAEIGRTPAWHLVEHVANGNDPVGMLGSNTGLVGVAGRPGVAPSNPDSNWGGVLSMRFFFSNALRLLGVTHYRVSFQEVSDAGVGFGPKVQMRNTLARGHVVGDTEHLFVLNDLADPSFYAIPYDTDPTKAWIDNAVHVELNTTNHAELPSHGRFVMSLELFTGASLANRVVPGTALDNAGHATLGFDFACRRPPNQVRPKHPYAALNHVFWWDNRDVITDITALHPTDPTSQKCQFISQPGSQNFHADFRVYHPEPKFMSHWNFNYARGLGAGSGTLDSGTMNAGQPPASAASTPPQTIAALLTESDGTTHSRCAFSLELNGFARTWNGIGRVSANDSRARAAVALLNTDVTG